MISQAVALVFGGVNRRAFIVGNYDLYALLAGFSPLAACLVSDSRNRLQLCEFRPHKGALQVAAYRDRQQGRLSPVEGQNGKCSHRVEIPCSVV